MNPGQDHFSGVAASYAEYRPRYPAALVDLLADLAPRRELAWDAGCGSGQLSVALAERFARVIATDASEQQLAQATAHPRVEYRRASAEACGISSATVDLATAAQAVHWFDRPAYYQEVRRVCRPGALIALVTYNLLRITPELDRIIDHFYWETIWQYWPPERRLVETGYRTLDFPFTELPAPPLEIQAEWALPHLLGFISTWSALRGLEHDRGGRVVEEFARELSGAWGAADTRRAVRWDLAVRLGRVS